MSNLSRNFACVKKRKSLREEACRCSFRSAGEGGWRRSCSDRADAYEKRLRAQYTALDTQMAKLNDLQSYVNKITSMISSG